MSNSPTLAFVAETRLGNHFLNSRTWQIHVLARALKDLRRMLPPGSTHFPRILDIGSGYGHAFAQLHEHFAPELIVGIDADPHFLARAGQAAQAAPCRVELQQVHAEALPFEDASFDLVFCHQSLHHIVDQEAALANIHRVLKPGGLFLFAESTRRYIHSWVIRLFFRHPMHVQRTAEEYIAMARAAGFELPAERVSLPFLWWSRPDLGALEWFGVPVPQQREETLINAVCRKPLA